jgi:lytic murein transglycosylase
MAVSLALGGMLVASIRGERGAALVNFLRIGLVAAAVAVVPVCMGSNAASANPIVRMSTPVPDEPVDQSAAFKAWLGQFRAEAQGMGISAETLDRALSGIRLNARVVELNENQPEFSRAVWDYLDSAVSSSRVERGREHLQKNRTALGRAEDKHGVPSSIITAIWSLESNFGNNMGSFNVIEALATLAFEGRRATFGREQLIAALRIIQSGDIEPRRMVGSWAGAMGQTQFIPTAFLQYAEDGNGDGRRDLWESKQDVFNSTANYLSSKGWQQDAPCFDEVQLPAEFDHAHADISIEKSVRQWASLGVTRLNGHGLVGRTGLNPDAMAAVILPGGYKGPAFIAYPNFKAVLAYNNAISYALAICQLSRRFEGGATFQTDWPRGETPILSRTDRLELQMRLNRSGFDVGEPDGVIGKKSREAIRAFQKKIGVPADGFATVALLVRLRGSS